MAVVLRFAPTGMTESNYSECLSRLEAAGAGSPPGRLYHVCFGDKSNLRVSDIWDTRENFEAFSHTLRPILEDLGIAGEPEFLEVHNTIEGVRSAATTAG
jgi:hypothetical protein